MRCLVVDDNSSFRDEMSALLTEQGLDVVGVAASAAEACHQIDALCPDVALIDIDLGDESGLELARQLSERARPGLPPSMILMSIYDEREYEDLIAASPAIGFLAKLELSATLIRNMLARHVRFGAGETSTLARAARRDPRIH